MNRTSNFFLSCFFIALSSIFSLWSMDQSNLGKRALPQETVPRAKVSATAIAQFENRFNSGEITLPLNVIVQAHLASETREQFASELLDYLENPLTYQAKNQTRNALAHKWIKNATSRIFSDENQFITELVMNACDASIDPINATGKNGIGFFSLFKLLELPAELIPQITLETMYRTTQNELKSYSIIFHSVQNPSNNAYEIVATFERKPLWTNSQTGTTIRITAQNKKFSDKMCATIEKKLKNSFRFYYNVPIILRTMNQLKAINLASDHTNPTQHVITTITPENIIIQDQGQGINLWKALQYLLAPSCSTNNQNTSQLSHAVKIPELIEPLDITKRTSHFFMTVNGITIIQKKLATPIIDSNHKSLDLHIVLPAQTRTTLAHNEIIISPEETNNETTTLKNIITHTVTQVLNNTSLDPQIIYGLYQGLELWENHSAQTHLKGYFSQFLQAELNKQLQESKTVACPIEFFDLYNKHFKNERLRVIPIHQSLVFNNYEPLEQQLKNIGKIRLATPTNNDKKRLQNKAAGGNLIFGMNIFFVNSLTTTSQCGLRSCIFAPEKEFFQNSIPTEQELINRLILELPEKHHFQTNLKQASNNIHLTPEQDHILKCFIEQHQPLFKRFNINPDDLIKPDNFAYSWIENVTRPLEPALLNRQLLTTQLTKDRLSFNMLKLITHQFQALPFLKNAFDTLLGTHYGSYQKLFDFSSQNIPFCYGNTFTILTPLFQAEDSTASYATIASLLHTLTNNWNDNHKATIEKMITMQMNDFVAKTAPAYRDKLLSQLQLYVPSSLNGTPLHTLGMIAKRKNYNSAVTDLIKMIVSQLQQPDHLAVLAIVLLTLESWMFDYICSPAGLDTLQSIINYYVKKNISNEDLKKTYQSLYYINCNDLSSLKKINSHNTCCQIIQEMITNLINSNQIAMETASTLPQELDQNQNIWPEQSFYLSQLFKAHCQKENFCKLLEYENLDEIVATVENFKAEKINKIEHCIENGSENNPIEGTIIECLQNSVDAAREFFHKHTNNIDASSLNKLATITMQLKSLVRTNNNQSLQFSIHDNIGFSSLQELLTHFALPDLSKKCSSAYSIGEMGNGAFKMYQKADVVNILTRMTNGKMDCYLLTIEPQRSYQTGLVEDLKLTCQNVSSRVRANFRGTTITTTFQEEPLQAFSINYAKTINFLHNSIGSTTVQLDNAIPFMIELSSNNETIVLNKDTSKKLIYNFNDDTNQTLIKVFKRPVSTLQSFITTSGIPLCSFEVFVKEQNLLPESFVDALKNGYIIDFQPNSYKPLQSRAKIQTLFPKSALRRAFLDFMYIHGLVQAIEETKFIKDNKIAPQDSCLSSRFTHFLSICAIHQLLPSNRDAKQFAQSLQTFLDTGILESNIIETKFFDFYHFLQGADKSFADYLFELQGLATNKINNFHEKNITALLNTHQKLIDACMSTAQDKDKNLIELKKRIKDELSRQTHTLNQEWFLLFSETGKKWLKETLTKLGKKPYDNLHYGLFVNIIQPWLTSKLNPMFYTFDVDYFSEYYMRKIRSKMSLPRLSKKQVAAENKIDESTTANRITNLFNEIQTKFCQKFLEAINVNLSVKKLKISCKMSKDLLETTTIGLYSAQENIIKINPNQISYLDFIQFIHLVNNFDHQSTPINTIHANVFFTTFYQSFPGNIPTLIHELEHARRAYHLTIYPDSNGCEKHNDGYDINNKLINFDACAHSWAEQAFKNNLLETLISVIQEHLRAQPEIAQIVMHIATSPKSPESQEVLCQLGGITTPLSPQEKLRLQQAVTAYEPHTKSSTKSSVKKTFSLESFLDKLSHTDDINAQDNNGCTALHEAVEYDNYQLIQMLLLQKANPNIQDYDGNTPLHKVYQKKCLHVNEALVTLLIDCGASLNVHNNQGQTPFHCAIQNNINISPTLLKKLENSNIINIKTGKTLLHEALDLAYGQNDELIKHLIEQGVATNLADIQGNLPLHYAVRNKSISLVEMLLTINPNGIHAQNKKGKTPLFYALKGQLALNVIQILISKGADFQAKDIDGNNCIHKMLSLKIFPALNFIKKVKEILGANSFNSLLQERNLDGQLPIDNLSADVAQTTFKFLMPKKQSIDLEYQDKDGNTLLHNLFCKMQNQKKYNSPTIRPKSYDTILTNIKYLLSFKPYHNSKKKQLDLFSIRNGFGLTCLEYIADTELKAFLQTELLNNKVIISLEKAMHCCPLQWTAMHGLTNFFQRHIANDNHSLNSTCNGMTALHVACFYGKLEIVKIILEKNEAFSNQEDVWGQTSLHWAIIGKRPEIINYLLKINPALYYKQDNFGKIPKDLAQEQFFINLLDNLKPEVNYHAIKHLI